MLSIKTAAALSFMLLVAVTAAGGQETAHPAQLKLAFDYSYMRANAGPGNCGCFNLSGGSAEAAFPVWRGFSVVGQVIGEHASSTNVQGHPLSLALVTGGPRFTYLLSRHERFAPFVQGLAGAVHGFDAPFPTSTGSERFAATAVAVLVGGGLDIVLRRHIDIRTFDADYGLTHLPNNVSGHQNLLRLSSGVVFRLP
jgi:hypothetical protein